MSDTKNCNIRHEGNGTSIKYNIKSLLPGHSPTNTPHVFVAVSL